MSFFLTLPFSLIAAKLPEYSCYQLTEEPLLDGKIEEEVWSTVPAVTGFYILGPRKRALQKQTYFKAGWNKRAIYIAVRSEEPEPEEIMAELKDGGSLWIEDSIELFFFPKKVENYLQFVVNAIGSRWNGIGLGEPPQPVWNWQAKTYVGKDFWSLEVRIPFEILKRVPEKEERWPANIARNIIADSPKERFTCWSPLEGGFHELINFGSFTFKGETLSLKETKQIEKKLNASYHNHLKARVNRIAERCSHERKFIEEQTENPKIQKEVISLKEEILKLNEISREKQVSIEEIRSALVKANNLLEKRLNPSKREVLLESLFEE